MKNLNLFSTYVLFAQAFFITATYSQITITSSDIQNKLDVQFKTVSYVSPDTSGLRSVINASGENNTWDLTGRTFTVSDTTTLTLLNKSSSGAPQQDFSVFSSAPMVVRRRTSSEPLFTNWSYESLTSTELYYYGYVKDSTGIVKANQTNAPSWRIQKFPTTYLTAWSWASTATARTYRSSGVVAVATDMTGNDIIDAYGTVTTPEGTFPCLRHKSITKLLLGMFTITTCNYEFLDQNRTYARIKTDETCNIPSSVTYYERVSTAGISETPNLVLNDFQLLQNYPNPFNPSTKIEFTLPKSERIIIKVYTTTGQKIETLIDKNLNAGHHELDFHANNLSSGIYLYRIEAGKYQDVKKMVLLR